MAFGAFQEGDLGLARVEGDTGVDHRVADFDDLSVQSSFYVVGAGGEGVRLTETGPYARRTVPEWLQGSSERGGALVTKVMLSAANGGLNGEAGTEEQERQEREWSVDGLGGIHEVELTRDVGDVHDDHRETQGNTEARSQRKEPGGEPLDAGAV